MQKCGNIPITTMHTTILTYTSNVTSGTKECHQSQRIRTKSSQTKETEAGLQLTQTLLTLKLLFQPSNLPLLSIGNLKAGGTTI